MKKILFLAFVAMLCSQTLMHSVRMETKELRSRWLKDLTRNSI